GPLQPYTCSTGTDGEIHSDRLSHRSTCLCRRSFLAASLTWLLLPARQDGSGRAARHRSFHRHPMGPAPPWAVPSHTRPTWHRRSTALCRKHHCPNDGREPATTGAAWREEAC